MNVDARIRIVLAASMAVTIAGAWPASGVTAAIDSMSRPRAAAAESAAAAPAAQADTAQGMIPTPEEASTPETVATPPAPAPVFLGGREIFRVRAPRQGISPAARASAIRARLNVAVQDVDTPADSAQVAGPVKILRPASGALVFPGHVPVPGQRLVGGFVGGG